MHRLMDIAFRRGQARGTGFRPAAVMLALLLVVMLWMSGCATTAPEEPSTPTLGDADIYAQAEALYQQGEYLQAVKLVGPLAQRGEARAQYIVGYMYFYGQGVQRNERVAYAWIGNAARQGYPPALDAVRTIQEKQAEAERRAQAGAEHSKPDTAPSAQTPAVVLPPESDESGLIDLRPRSAAPPPVVLPEVPPAMLSQPAEPESTAPPTSRALSSSESPADAAPQQPTQFRDSAWVMTQPSDGYTIQLLSGTSRDDALSFMNTHDLELEVALFDYVRGGVQWYSVLYGVFATLTQARSALQQLSPELLAKEPWIRPMESIQALRTSL